MDVVDFAGRTYAMCQGRRKGTSTKELDIINWAVIGQLLLFLFGHGDPEVEGL